MSRFVKVVGVIFFCSATIARCDLISTNPPAKKKRTPVLMPAQAVPVKVRVMRGESVNIPLRVYGEQSQVISFIIRSQPEFGSLSELSRTRGEITYHHSGETTQKVDKFSYAAKSEDGISAPVEVTISIKDAPSLFLVPEAVEFGAVTIGRTARRAVVLENQGGGTIEGELEIDEPWEVEGATNYRLGEGKKQKFTIVFTPQNEQEFRGRIRYSSDPGRETRLHGVAQAPFAVTPENLELRARGNDTTRSGALEISNRTEEIQKLKIVAGERLQANTHVDLPASGTQSIEVKVSPTDLDPLETSLRIQSKTFHTEVTVTAAAVGAVLRAEPSAISFGSVQIGGQPSESIVVQNIGGARTLAQVEVPAPFVVADEDRSFSLAPAEKRSVRLSIRPENPGGYRSWLKIHSYENELEIPIEAEVKGGQVAKTNLPPATSIFSSAATELPQEKINPRSQVPPIDGITIKKIDRSSCYLEWKAPSNQPLTYRLEMRKLSLDQNRKLKIEWLAYGDFVTQKSGDRVSARLTKLEAGRTYTARISSVTNAGEVSLPSPAIVFSTKPGFNLSITPLRVLSLLLVVLVAFVIREKTRASEPARPSGGLR